MCRVLGGDATLAEEILAIQRVQERLREEEDEGGVPHPARVFGRFVEEQQQLSSELLLSRHRLQKRQLELEGEDMERQAKYRREEEDRRAEIRREEDERTAAQKKEETAKQHALEMQRLVLQEDKMAEAHKAFGIEKTAKHAEHKERVEQMVIDGSVSREAADRLLQESRVCVSRHTSLAKMLEKLWSGPNASVSRDLPRNLIQRFYEAYTVLKSEHFPDKPLGDFKENNVVLWYDTDLVAMWKFAEHLKAEEAEQRRRGSSTLSFGNSNATRVPPSFEECRHKFGLCIAAGGVSGP
jgi:hypothetical protein